MAKKLLWLALLVPLLVFGGVAGLAWLAPDTATGLIYYRARWFDPRIGRFISEDPIGFAAGDTNLSRYVGNSIPRA